MQEYFLSIIYDANSMALQMNKLSGGGTKIALHRMAS